jgi:hypothetical protein
MMISGFAVRAILCPEEGESESESEFLRKDARQTQGRKKARRGILGVGGLLLTGWGVLG